MHSAPYFHDARLGSRREDGMEQLKKARELADAASHLCAAYEELAAAGYEVWSAELKALIDIIDAEMSVAAPSYVASQAQS